MSRPSSPGSFDLAHSPRSPAAAAARRRAVEALAALPQVTIAVTEAAVAGPGLEIALVCDLRLASTEATFHFREVSEGLVPGASVTQRLPRLVGHSHAAELVLTAASVGAIGAQEIGLVHHAVPPAELQALVDKSSQTLRAARRSRYGSPRRRCGSAKE